VRHHDDAERLGQRRDPAQLGDAADLGHARLRERERPRLERAAESQTVP
jgi:hypothetical protein